MENANKFIEDIKPFVTFKKENKVINNIFENKKIIFSGFRDILMEENISNLGGKITTSISKNTNILIVADRDTSSSKMKKAEELGIDIYTKQEFIDKYKL